MGEILGRNQNDKNGFFSIFLHKIICCGCVLDEAILIHILDILFYGELMIIKVKKHWSFVKTLCVWRRSRNVNSPVPSPCGSGSAEMRTQNISIP